jgi:hypothetical protein
MVIITVLFLVLFRLRAPRDLIKHMYPEPAGLL